MDQRLSGESSAASPASAVPSLTFAAEVARCIATAPDREAIERLLVALAIHPHGASCARAFVVRRRTEADEFVIGPSARAGEPEASLPELLRHVAAASSTPSRKRPRASFPGAAFRDVIETAWTRGECTIGAVGTAREGISEIGAFPLRIRLTPYALLVGEWAESSLPADARARFESLSACAEWALGQVTAARDAAARARQAAAMADLARALVSPANVAEILHRGARLAAEATDSAGSAIWTADAAGAARLAVTFGAADERERIARSLHAAAGRAMSTSKPYVVDQPIQDFLVAPEAADGMASARIVPLIAYGRVHGAVAIYERSSAASRSTIASPHDGEFLGAIADLCALAIDHAASFQDLARAGQRHRELVARQSRLERLAAVGEAARGIAHESKNPLASVRAFTRRLHEQLDAADVRKEYLEIVMREVERLDHILAAPLEMGAADPPSLRMQSLNDVLQESLAPLGEALVRRRIRLLKKLSPEIPALLLDGERIGQAIGNLLHAALEAVAVGGRIRVETRRAGGCALAEIAHDGPCAPGDAIERLFMPFAASRTGSPAIGLAAAQKIVREHGGEVRVRSEGEWSTVITLTLPIPDNQDRRKMRGERRRGGERRARVAGA